MVKNNFFRINGGKNERLFSVAIASVTGEKSILMNKAVQLELITIEDVVEIEEIERISRREYQKLSGKSDTEIHFESTTDKISRIKNNQYSNDYVKWLERSQTTVEV